MIPGTILSLPWRYIVPGIGAALLIWAAYGWHAGKVEAAFVRGAKEQAAADTLAFTEAQRLAAAAQAKIIVTAKAEQAKISKGTADDLQKRNDDIARSYADLRLRWAAREANSGGPGQSGATAAAGAAAGAAGAACAAQGWVSLDVAATAAEAADTAIARDDAWRAWYEAQATAWPK